MSTLAIFVLGFFVTTIVVVAAALVGLSEAGDPTHSRLGDLSALERALVDRESEATSAESHRQNETGDPA
jgi:hypothetical protein